MIIKGKNKPIYFRKINDSEYETVNPAEVTADEILFSVESNAVTDNIPDGYFYFVPKFIFASQITAKKATVTSQTTTGITGANGTSIVLTVNERDILITFTPTTDLDVIVSRINTKVREALGTKFSNFAKKTPDARIILTVPEVKNSQIIIPENSIFVTDLNFTAGEYIGDLPALYRSYVDDETFVLFTESTTPNKGTASGEFFPVKNSNGILRYLSDFDKELVKANPRLEMMVDGYAFIVQRINQEIDKFVNRIDLSKIQPDEIEKLAYQFGINLESLLESSENGLLSAREVLRSIMGIIQSKGTINSFVVLFRFISLLANVIELRPDPNLNEIIFDPDNVIPDSIDEDGLVDFYDRFLVKDSIYRNPIVNYGVTVPDTDDLPSEPFDGEYARVTVTNNIYQYDGTDWNIVFNTTDPIIGQGNDPDPAIAALNWQFEEKNRLYINIDIGTYNDLTLIEGFQLRAGNGGTFNNDIFNVDIDDPIIENAFIFGDQAEPFDLSAAEDRTLSLLLNGDTEITIDFTDFQTQVSSLSAVTIAEIKEILETNYPDLIVGSVELPITVSGGSSEFRGISLLSRRSGTKSSIRVLGGNSKLGIDTGTFVKVHQSSTHVKISPVTGQTNSIAHINDTEITLPDTILTIQSEALTPPLDGIYSLYLKDNGNIVVTSENIFFGSAFDANFGWISEEFEFSDVILFGTIEVKDGEFIYLTEQPKQSDYKVPNASKLTLDQNNAVRSFIRSKLATAEDYRFDTDAIGTQTEGILTVLGRQANGPFYDRNGVKNENQDLPYGLSNSIFIDLVPFTDSFVLNQQIIDQTEEFVNYVRPAHIQILSLLFNVPELFDRWPRNDDAVLGQRPKNRTESNSPYWQHFLYEKWSPWATYQSGSIISYNGVLYVATATTTAGQVPTSTSDWKPYEFPGHIIDIMSKLDTSFGSFEGWLTGSEIQTNIGYEITIENATLSPQVGMIVKNDSDSAYGYIVSNVAANRFLIQNKFFYNPVSASFVTSSDKLSVGSDISFLDINASPLGFTGSASVISVEDTVPYEIGRSEYRPNEDVNPSFDKENLAPFNTAKQRENLFLNDISVDNEISTTPYSIWNKGSAYNIGDVVLYEGDFYKALSNISDTVINPSPLGNASWERTTLVSIADTNPEFSYNEYASILVDTSQSEVVTFTNDLEITVAGLTFAYDISDIPAYPDLTGLQTQIESDFNSGSPNLVTTELTNSNKLLRITDATGTVSDSPEQEPISFVDNTDSDWVVRHSYNPAKRPMINDIFYGVYVSHEIEEIPARGYSTSGTSLFLTGTDYTTYNSKPHKGVGVKSDGIVSEYVFTVDDATGISIGDTFTKAGVTGTVKHLVGSTIVSNDVSGFIRVTDSLTFDGSPNAITAVTSIEKFVMRYSDRYLSDAEVQYKDFKGKDNSAFGNTLNVVNSKQKDIDKIMAGSDYFKSSENFIPTGSGYKIKAISEDTNELDYSGSVTNKNVSMRSDSALQVLVDYDLSPYDEDFVVLRSHTDLISGKELGTLSGSPLDFPAGSILADNTINHRIIVV